jgi:hypothetical protein
MHLVNVVSVCIWTCPDPLAQQSPAHLEPHEQPLLHAAKLLRAPLQLRGQRALRGARVEVGFDQVKYFLVGWSVGLIGWLVG